MSDSDPVQWCVWFTSFAMSVFSSPLPVSFPYDVFYVFFENRYYYNDEEVRQMQEEDLVDSSTAYLLFYIRR